MADSEESLRVHLLDEALTKWEMKMDENELGEDGSNEGKEGEDIAVWKLGTARKLESLEVVKYLGVMISDDGRMEEEIRSRIWKAARVIGMLNEQVWKGKELNKTTKMKVPTLMYEMWALNKQQESEMKVLRFIAEKSWMDRVRNVEI